jgi:hypothetical protein
MLILEGFRSTLEIQFQEPTAPEPRKSKKGEFVTQDTITKRDIDLRTDWETCFVPGQKSHDEYDPHSSLGAGRKMPKCDAPNIHSSIFGRNVDIDW